jgi:adenylate kinase
MKNDHHREVIILIGKPGSGKGTQAEPLARALGIPFVSVGKMLREEIKKGTAIGKKAAAGVAAGRLVPNILTIILLKRRLAKPDAKKGIVIDGFPRDLEQALILSKFARVAHAVLISITDKEVVRRISGRRICSKCGQNYHIEAFKPKRPGICDKCGGRIVRRDDDKPKIIRERLVSYREDTIPVLRFYRQKRVLRRVDAQAGIAAVGKKIIEVIKQADEL